MFPPASGKSQMSDVETLSADNSQDDSSQHKWKAVLRFGGKDSTLGTYMMKEQAAAAYDIVS